MKLRQVFEIKNPWWSYRKDDVVLPSGKPGEYHFVHVLGSSMIVPILDDGKMILVNQYRYLLNRESIEFPCGSVKEGSTYDETARHELAEETGFEADQLVCAGEFDPYNGVTDEICKVYIARKLHHVMAAHDETEEFERIHLSPQKFDEMIKLGKVWDGMTLAAWALVKHTVLA
ncbi:MAG: NUDIX hydrolase [Ignavibacteria bacterium]|nr:NUDIX hydrolase [Ignavibacteria bacterium]